MVIFSVFSNILGAGFVCRHKKSPLFVHRRLKICKCVQKTPALRGWSVALAAGFLASLWLRGYSYSNSYWYGYLAGSARWVVFLLCCHWNIFIGY